MINRKTLVAAVALVGALAPGVAQAHVGVGGTVGFASGFGHPLGGLDHLLAMVMVGVCAWQIGGRALWLVPVTFVAVMAVGGAVGVLGLNVPFVEIGIALSVLVLGGLVALGVRLPTAALMAVVGLFAVFHGHAHGTEMPETAGGLAYGLGFMIATALLHLGGIGLGYGVARLGRAHGPVLVRATGAATALAGVFLLGSVLMSSGDEATALNGSTYDLAVEIQDGRASS